MAGTRAVAAPGPTPGAAPGRVSPLSELAQVRDEALVGLRAALAGLWTAGGDGGGGTGALLDVSGAVRAAGAAVEAAVAAAHARLGEVGAGGRAGALERELRTRATALLTTTAPRAFPEALRGFYTRKLADLADASAAAEEGGAGAAEAAARLGAAWAAELQAVGQGLHSLGLGPVSEEAYAQVICASLGEWLESTARGAFDDFCLGPALRHTRAVHLRFLALLLPEAHGALGAVSEAGEGLPVDAFLDAASGEGGFLLQQWESRLDFFVFHALGDMRTAELFDIVVDFPESAPALRDLRECLAHTGRTPRMIEEFGSAVRRRLLHAAAATGDILTQYVSMCRALREVDPSGIVLEAVAGPVQEYLAGRKDTVNKIMAMLVDDTEDGDEQLQHDLASTAQQALGGAYEGEDILEDEWGAVVAGQNWEPDPADTGLDSTGLPGDSAAGGLGRGVDVAGMLLEVFQDKERYTSEYRAMLGQILLSQVGYTHDREKRILQLLKLRLPEKALHSCEVMLKDMADSKRINANIKILKQNSDIPLGIFDALIVSEEFWPSFQGEEVTPAARIQEVMDVYAAGYKKLKNPRSLHWRTQLGVAELELHLGGRSRVFQTSAARASIILRFEEKPEWLASELAATVEISDATLRGHAEYWAAQGVLEVADAPYGDLRYSVKRVLGEGSGEEGENEEEIFVLTNDQVMEKENKMYESYVMTMLTNNESLQLERIHNMLKMFMIEPKYNKSLVELETFLEGMMEREKVVFEAGVYKRKHRIGTAGATLR